MRSLNEIACSYRQDFKDAKVGDGRIYPCIGEGKFDGEFVAIFSNGNGIVIANRHKSQYSPTRWILPYLPKGIYVLLAEYISLRGDLYCYLEDRAKPDCKTLALRVHSIIYLNNQDCRSLDYETRYDLLRKLIPEDNEYVSVIKNKKLYSKQDVQEYFDEMLKEGREGIVIKSLGNLYESAQKIKRKTTYDLPIMGIEKTKNYLEDGIGKTFLFGIWKDNRWQVFGRGTGMTDSERAKLTQLVLPNKIGEDKENIYVKPEVVVEVEFQEVKQSGFRHPALKRIRYDKTVSHSTVI